MYRTRDGQSPNIEIILLDTAFQQRWGGLIRVEPKYQLANQVVSNKKVYFLFANKVYSDIHFLVFEVDLASGNYTRYVVRNFVPFRASAFEATANGLLIGGYFAGRIPVVIFFDFLTQKSKVLPGLFNESGELLQISTESSGNFNVLINARNVSRQRTLWIKRYTAHGDLLQNEILNPIESSSLLFGRALALNENQQLIAGVYGQRNSDYSRGIFMAHLNEEDASEPIYFPFADLENFFKFMKVKREKRIKERIQRKKIKGKKIRFQYRFLVHEFVEYDDEYILLGEAFYPRYRSVERSGYTGINQSTMVFDGYQYTHAVIIGFSKEGELIWDNSFEINDVRTFTLEQFVKMDLQEDKIVLLYLFDSKIRSKIIQNNTVLEGKSLSELNRHTYSPEGQKVGKLEYWYNGYFLASGIQNIGRPGIGRQTRQIFFVNKIRFE